MAARDGYASCFHHRQRVTDACIVSKHGSNVLGLRWLNKLYLSQLAAPKVLLEDVVAYGDGLHEVLVFRPRRSFCSVVVPRNTKGLPIAEKAPNVNLGIG